MKRRILSMLLVGIFVFATGCTKEEKKDVYELEGGDKAYITYNEKIVTLENPTSVIYSVKDLSGDYLTAAKHACTQVSGVSSGIDIKVKTTTSKNDAFVFNTTTNKNATYNAINGLAIDKTSSKVVGSVITFNKAYMDDYGLKAKKMLAMHEMGHTLGLKDFYSGSYVYDEDATVMKGVYKSGYSVFTTYTEFDKKCIQHKYGK